MFFEDVLIVVYNSFSMVGKRGIDDLSFMEGCGVKWGSDECFIWFLKLSVW